MICRRRTLLSPPRGEICFSLRTHPRQCAPQTASTERTRASLRARCERSKYPMTSASVALECVQLEADCLSSTRQRLPWETVSTELRIMRVFHSDASIWQSLFSLARLAPASFYRLRSNYRWRRQFSEMPSIKLPAAFFPFPVPDQIERQEKPTYELLVVIRFRSIALQRGEH